MGKGLEAPPEHPYLSLRLNLDREEIARLVLELGDLRPSPAAADRGLFVARLDEPLLDAVLRMVKLLDTPEDIGVLAPVVQREIYYRILRGDLGSRLVDLAQSEGGSHRIVRAIEWLKQNYAVPLRIEELAGGGVMSPAAQRHPLRPGAPQAPPAQHKQFRAPHQPPVVVARRRVSGSRPHPT